MSTIRNNVVLICTADESHTSRVLRVCVSPNELILCPVCEKNTLLFLDIYTPGLITEECPICYKPDLSAVQIKCGHRFCVTCIGNWSEAKMNLNETPSCPCCREPVDFLISPHNLNLKDVLDPLHYFLIN